jgi:O-antigen ligase
VSSEDLEVSTGGVRRLLVSLAVLTLPFTAALTLNLRFPLKIYEVALLGAGLTCLSQLRIPTLRSASTAARWVAALVGWAVAVLLLHLWLPPEGVNAAGFESRFGPLGDELAKILYLLLSLFGFLLIAQRTYEEEQLVLRLWLIGAIAAALYSWYLFTSSLLGRPPFLLPGVEKAQLFAFGDRVVIRSGTFEEGNFFGLYLVLSTMIALYARRLLTAVFLAASVLITFSTVNFAALALLSAILIWRGPAKARRGRRLLSVVAGVLVLAGAGALLLGTGYLENVVSGKLVGQNAISRLDRLGLALTGLRMFADHPITGVGISQFGYYYRSYELFDLNSWTLFFDLKRIPNNVYIELLAELGIVGLALFAAFVSRIWRHLRRPELFHFRLGFLAMLLAWNAFPSYSIMFLWAFWGVILGTSARLAERSAPRPEAHGYRLAGIH